MKQMKQIMLSIFTVLLVFTSFQVDVSANTDEGYNDVYGAQMVSDAFIEKAKPYVMLRDDRYVYVHNEELSVDEGIRVQMMIDEANERIADAEAVASNVVERTDDAVIVSSREPMVSVYSDGVTGVAFYWWGIRIHLSKTTAQWVCEGAVTVLVALIGGAIAKTIASILGSGICHFGVRHGVWLDYNYFWANITAVGWQ